MATRKHQRVRLDGVKGRWEDLDGDEEVFIGDGEEINVYGKALDINEGGVKRCQWGAKRQWGGINPLNAGPEYPRVQNMCPCRGPQVYSGAECVFRYFSL